MRIILKKGKQKELIKSAKSGMTWRELAEKLNHCVGYVVNDLRNERRSLSEIDYNILCNLSKNNFNRVIIDKLDDNWGRSKGGKSSLGNTKKFVEPPENKELAELFGIILGDGHVEKIKIGNKIRAYSVVITGDSIKDNIYLSNYVSGLFKRLFGEEGNLRFSKESNSIHLKIYGKKIIEFIERKGIKPGNKKLNNQKIPDWILNNKKYLESCLRGLIDTDGCIYYISRNNRNLRISFTSYIPKLLNEVRKSFIKLGFHPSKIIREKDITLSRKEDIEKFLKEIGFSNNKHLKRLQDLIKNASLV